LTQLLEGLRKADLNQGTFSYPKIINKLDADDYDVENVIKNNMSRDEFKSYQIIVFILPYHEDSFYNAYNTVKRFACENGVITQCVLRNNLYGKVNQAVYQGLWLNLLTKTSSTVYVVNSPAWQIAEIKKYNPVHSLPLSRVLSETEANDILKKRVILSGGISTHSSASMTTPGLGAAPTQESKPASKRSEPAEGFEAEEVKSKEQKKNLSKKERKKQQQEQKKKGKELEVEENEEKDESDEVLPPTKPVEYYEPYDYKVSVIMEKVAEMDGGILQIGVDVSKWKE
jgi:hypothetical protein